MLITNWVTAILLMALLFAPGIAMSADSFSPENLQNRPSRYFVSVSSGVALLVDTETGCVWQGAIQSMKNTLGDRSNVREFRLVSVEGLYNVSTPAEELQGTQRTLPAKCVSSVKER